MTEPMIQPFQFAGTPKIVFGPDRSASILKWLHNYGKNVLVVTGGNAYRTNKVIASLIDELDKLPLHTSYARIGNEPSPSVIDDICREQKNYAPDIVLAIGGGSVIDAGKAVSAMLPLDTETKDYLEGVGKMAHPGIKKFFVAVPTTAGTGSEATYNAVLSETGRNGFKRSLRHEKLIPDVAVVDPKLCIECPPHITAQSGMDAFTQLTESYLSVKASPLTEALSLEGISRIHACLKEAYRDGTNLEARTGMSLAALFSGITLANAGLGLVHGFASSVGGYTNIPHGVVCGTLMGVVNRYTVEALLKQQGTSPAHVKYAKLGSLFSGESGKSMEWYMRYSITYIESLIDYFSIPRLQQYGIAEDNLTQIAAATEHKAHPVVFDVDVLAEMLRERL